MVGTGICLVPQHEPIVTAKAIATLDQLSNGRQLRSTLHEALNFALQTVDEEIYVGIDADGVIAHDATVSDALRNNCLFAISLGLATGERAKRCVEAAQKYLVVPGGLRTLALSMATEVPGA